MRYLSYKSLNKSLIEGKSNFVVFVLPLFFVSLLFYFGDLTPRAKTLVFAASSLIDSAHVYTTFVLLFFSKKLVSYFSFRKLLVIGLLTLLALFLIFSLTSHSQWTWYFIAAGAIFHFIKQQVGWMKIATKGQAQSELQTWIDLLSIYTLTGITVIYRLTVLEQPNWFLNNDLPKLDEKYFTIACLIFALSQICFFSSNIYNSFKSKLIPTAKLNIWLSTFIGWFFALIILEDMSLTVSLLLLQHGLPYLVLISKKSETQVDRVSRKIFKVYLVLMGGFLLGYLNYYIIASPKFEGQDFLQRQATAALFAIYFGAQFIHYAYDSFLWKAKHKLIFANLDS